MLTTKVFALGYHQVERADLCENCRNPQKIGVAMHFIGIISQESKQKC